MKKIIAIIIVIVILSTGAIFFWQYTQTPEYSFDNNTGGNIGGDQTPASRDTNRGHITFSPSNPSWLVYQNGNPFFLCGSGDPEGFLYRDDQMQLINKMKGTGANGIYFQAVRSHGGDGRRNENPFINNDPSKGIDMTVLNKWEQWFTEMDKSGTVMFFFFYDDGSAPFGKGGTMPPGEREFVQTLVNRFKHHKHLIWVIAEEYQEVLSRGRVSQIASEVRKHDSIHPIASHQLSGTTFDHPGDPNINQFAIQMKVGSAGENHNIVLEAWNKAKGRYNLNLAEPQNVEPTSDNRDFNRKRNWAVAMGGAYIMPIEWMIDNTPLTHLQDCGRLVQFMERTDVHTMAPNDGLAFGGTEYVLANPGKSYIAYASSLSGDIGLRNMTAGTYDFLWYDVMDGTSVEQKGVSVGSGNQLWKKPSGIGNELAVFIKRN